MMKLIILILVLALFYYGCSPRFSALTGVYKSTCTLYHYTALKLTVKPDSSFYYNLLMLDDTIKGRCVLYKDTLTLYSPFFNHKLIKPLTPMTKNTDLIDKDAYLVKGKKLYEINMAGVSKSCYLVRVRKL